MLPCCTVNGKRHGIVGKLPGLSSVLFRIVNHFTLTAILLNDGSYLVDERREMTRFRNLVCVNVAELRSTDANSSKNQLQLVIRCCIFRVDRRTDNIPD